MQVRRGKLQVILLVRVGHRAADEEHAAQKRRDAAVLFEVFLADAQADLAARVAERGDHPHARLRVGNRDRKRARAAAALLRAHLRVHVRRNGRSLRKPVRNGRVFTDHARFPQGKAL